MKLLFTLSLFLALGCGTSFAQNSVTVSQNGNGNKATISQSSGDSFNTQELQSSCDEEAKLRSPGNNITIQSNGKTIIDSTNNISNRYHGVITNKNELSIFQYGSANNLFILPDSTSANNLFASYQNGTGNTISALLSSSHQNLDVSQSGTGNSAAINPCGAGADTSIGSGNTANVSMNGDGNSVHINQN